MEYFDLHCDTVNKYSEKAVLFKSTALKVCDKKVFKKQSQCLALWIPDDITENKAKEKRYELFEDFQNVSDYCSKNGIKTYLTLENSKGIGEETEFWKNRNVLTASLTWNGENEYGHGAGCKKGGLKEKGEKLISRYEAEGIILDVSHLNFQSFWDVCKIATRPFIASHSNCYSVCRHRRNLKDEQITEIIKRGGLIGLCFYPVFLGKGDVFENIYRNICHIICLGGEDVISLGSDFDGAKMDEKLKNSTDVAALYAFLKSKSISDELISKIFYKNSENFFNNVLH